MEDEELLTFKQAMERLQIKSYNTLYKYIDEGLKVTHLGKSKRISKRALNDFIEKNTK